MGGGSCKSRRGNRLILSFDIAKLSRGPKKFLVHARSRLVEVPPVELSGISSLHGYGDNCRLCGKTLC